MDALPFDKTTGSILSSQENDDGGSFMLIFSCIYFNFNYYLMYPEIWLESICEVSVDNDVHNNKVLTNGSVLHKKSEKQETLCTEVSTKKIVTNDKLM